MPLLLLIGLTFSTSSAALNFNLFSVSAFYGKPDARCKVGYSMLDLNTGLDKSLNITSQFDIDDDDGFDTSCRLGVGKLLDKINTEMVGDSHVLVSMTEVYCKKRMTIAVFYNDWSAYQKCKYEFNEQMIDELRYNNKVGYNINVDRFIREKGIEDTEYGDI
jgi:hypothetical protein